ncbi:PREDICTED: rho GTPase-activating protein 11A isoform X1 [Thamnophis sirtalis]|uniref:Rho GTPase-activating protein 11A isoform X1 n=2 Tax=Thamnophis sirtalis TaxID=35019 RepID=A0A6I9YCS8_9SAUR|nr:PREDICTED: rho GTPase-activating protein 11A isoform X1 [Thamnophis sirtalis]
MDGPGKRLAQLAVQQQLRAAYGIKLKNRTGKRKASRSTVAGGGKVFGIFLQELPQVVCEYGNIPCFLVEACQYLEEHIQIEGLFRKSGSVVRLKTLKNKMDKGENCLSSALPCDVAGLLKQFFRELPEPILPYNLQEALIKAQKLESEERNSATLLISCLVNEGIIETLRYFFQFLKKVSLRSAENKMDSCNLALVFAPNLLQSSEIEKISVHTEKKVRLQAGVVQTLIDHAEKIGQIPKFILEKIPSILSTDYSASTPVLHDDQESEIETPSEHLRRRRQSIGDIVSGALNKLKSNRTPSTTPQRDQCVFSSMTPVMVTPNFKRKYPADSCQRLSSKKRRSVGHSTGPEMLPNTLFNISLTPGSAPFVGSPFASLDTSQASLSTSATCEKSLSNIRSRRSKRIANKKVQRVESGKTGCFSPKISRKEVVRRSLRLKFILGRSNRQNTAVEHEDNHRAENIGHRLAGHQDKENGVETMKTATLLSPCVGLKNFSKSEENLQTPSHHTAANYRMSWIGPATTDSQDTRISLMGCPETEISSSETAPANRKPLVIPTEPMFSSSECDSSKQKISFCEDENNSTEHMLMRIKKAFSESGSNLHDLYEKEPSTSNLLKLKNNSFKKTDKKVDFKEKPQVAKSVTKSNTIDQVNAINGLFQNNKSDHSIHILNQSDGLEEIDQLITSHVIQINNVNNVQKKMVESNKPFICPKKESKYCNTKKETSFSEGGDKNDQLFLQTESYDKSKSSPSAKVAEHIHWFNKLSLNEPHSATRSKPVLKFQRTPVRQSVRRINSLLETHKQSVTCKRAGDGCTSLAKSVSYETALSSCAVTTDHSLTNSLPSKQTCKENHDQLALFPKSYPHLIYSSEQTVKETFNNNSKSVLEDLTNHEAPKTVVKTSTSLNASVGTPDKYVLRKMAGTKSRYRGSPKNPIRTAKLLPIVKPVDL